MSEIINKIAKERYLRGDEKTMNDVYKRVSIAVGNNVNPDIKPPVDRWDTEFYLMMHDGIFLPNSPTLMNAGTDNQMLSACFALPVNDSFFETGGIMNGVNNSVRIMKMGGGVGYNFSHLRPAGSVVKSTDGVASGPVSFMKFYNSAIDVVKQGGRRRGAAIGILNIDHPDIEEFIDCKDTEGDYTNFNLSVMVTHPFMYDVTANDLTEYHGNTIERVIKNKALFTKIVKHIHKNGEPGVLFYDNINKDNPNKHLYDIYTTNPCGEIPIGVDPVTGGGEACNLGSINLVKFYNPKYKNSVDWDKLSSVVRDATIFLDTIIDMNKYPTEAIATMTRSTRKIGLGFMGLHDLLIMSGISYASEEGRHIAEDIMDFIRTVAIGTSVELARHSDVYEAYIGSKWEDKGIEVRNSTLTCIAPTGTLSILANCSSGIEPYFNWVYERKNTVGSTFKIVVPLFEEAMKNFIKDCSDFEVKAILYNNFGVVTYDMQDKYVDNNNRWVMEDGNAVQFEGDIRDKMYECICEECFSTGTIQHLDFIPKEMRKVFMNAGDISWQDHVKMQIALQKHCDNSISKTINMSNSATEQEIADAIIMAWKGGCKGLTLYRDGSREKVVLSNKTEWSDASSAIESIEIDITTRGEEHQNTHVLPSSTFDVCTGCGDMYIHVAEMNGKPRKVFINNAGNGGCEANTAAIGRLISLGLKHNVPIREIIKQLRKVKCNSCLNNKKAEGKSCSDIIGKTLEECIPDDEVKVVIKPSVKLSGTMNADYINKNFEHICYNCQSTMIPEGNCWVCINCGMSKCG